MRSVRLRTGIQHSFAGFQLSGINPDKCQLADKRVGHDLESESRERFVVGGLADDGFAIVGIRACHFARIERRREEIYNGVE